MSAGQFSFIKLYVADLDSMIAFYTAVFDMAVHIRIDEADFEEVLLRQEGHGFMLGLLNWKTGGNGDERPAAGVIGFVTQDADTTVARAIKAGARIKRAPFDIPGTRVALIDDPEGHEIELVQFL